MSQAAEAGTGNLMMPIPQCEHPGCEKQAQWRGKYNKNGDKCYRKHEGKYICQMHWFEFLALRKNTTVSEFLKLNHPYLKYRKDYCENARGEYTGWLPVPCVIDVFPKRFLQVDHLDGDHENNSPDNLMTLCPTCHAVKTWIFDCVSLKNISPAS